MYFLFCVLSAKMWQLAPQQTRHIINLVFRASQLGMHYGYVHINTDDKRLIVPVEISVVEHAVEAVQDEINFGTITIHQQKRTRSLKLRNLLSAPVAITDVHTLTPDSSLVIRHDKVSL